MKRCFPSFSDPLDLSFNPFGGSLLFCFFTFSDQNHFLHSLIVCHFNLNGGFSDLLIKTFRGLLLQKMYSWRKKTSFHESAALSCRSGPSAIGTDDRERERVRKRDWHYNRLACIFVPLHGPSERQHLKIALPSLVIYITLSAVLSLSSGTRGGATRVGWGYRWKMDGAGSGGCAALWRPLP